MPSETEAEFRSRFTVRVSDEPGDFDGVLDRLAELLVTIAEREIGEEQAARETSETGCH